MSDTHSIRLHGPWEILTEDSETKLPSSRRVQVPAEWNLLQFPPEINECRLFRFFNSPTGLLPETDVWLVLEVSHWEAAVLLNQSKLGEIRSIESIHRFLITDLIQPRNKIEVQLQLLPNRRSSQLHEGKPATREINQPEESRYPAHKISIEIHQTGSQ